MGSYQSVFTPSCLEGLFPAEERTAAFFDALFGDAADGAYDIRLTFQRAREGAAEQLEFFFELHQRRGMCLACNLTHGLPQVFRRHPVIALNDLCAGIARRAGWTDGEWSWELGETEEVSDSLHVIPLKLMKN